MIRRIAQALLLLGLILTPGPAQAAELKSPFSVTIKSATSGKGRDAPCPAAPPAIINLEYNSIYKETDPTSSTVDPGAQDRYRKDIEPLQDFETAVVRRANAYVRSQGKDIGAAACALSWLSSWAGQNAMGGEATRHGEAVRKWALGTFASTYLQIAGERRLNSKQKVVVKKWLYNLARKVMSDYTRNPDSSSRRNNHVYWAAWAVGMTGVAIQNEKFFDWAMDKARVGLIQIEADGTLPLEVRRASRAQVYHLFATTPLVFLAELAQRNRIDLYSYNNGALHRLVKMNVTQMLHSDYIQHRAGAKQFLDKKSFPILFSWLEVYTRRFSFKDEELQKEADKILKQNRPFFSRRTGGETTLLYGAQ